MTGKIVEIEFLNSEMRANGVYAADAYGHEMPFYEGYKIVKDRTHVRTVTMKQERKWCHRQRFQKDERFKTHTETRPCKFAMVEDDCIRMHPTHYSDIRAQTATRNYSGSEAIGAYMAQSMIYAMERPGFLRMMLGETD